jgi:hypothetical protein
MRLSRALMWLLLPLLLLAIAGPIVDVFTPLMVPSLQPLAASAWVGVGMTLVALVCATTLEHGKLRRLMISGLIAAAIAQLIWTGALWVNSSSEQTWYVVSAFATPLTGWAVLTALLGMLMRSRLDSSIARGWRMIAVVLVSLLALHAVLAITFYPLVGARQIQLPRVAAPMYTRDRADYVEGAMRLGGALAILLGWAAMGLAFSIALPKLRGDAPAPEAAPRPFQATCPRCEAQQELQTSGDACRSCGLRIKVTPT